MREEIETKLSSAFSTLVKETYSKGGRFFLSKSATDSSHLTQAAVKAIKTFNEHASEGKQVKGLKQKALRDYFLTKASTSTCTCKAASSLNGLQMIMG